MRKPDRALVFVCVAGREELVGDRARVLHAVELEGHGSVPVEAQPAQRLLDLLGRLVDLAGRVGVLDAEPELAALVARKQPVE